MSEYIRNFFKNSGILDHKGPKNFDSRNPEKGGLKKAKAKKKFKIKNQGLYER